MSEKDGIFAVTRVQKSEPDRSRIRVEGGPFFLIFFLLELATDSDIATSAAWRLEPSTALRGKSFRPACFPFQRTERPAAKGRCPESDEAFRLERLHDVLEMSNTA